MTVHPLKACMCVVIQSKDRGGTSVQSKTRSLTPFNLRSNREGLAALCQKAAASTLPDSRQQATVITDQRRSAAETLSTSPLVTRETHDQRPTGGPSASSTKTAAELSVGSSTSASLDARLQQTATASSRYLGPRTFGATAGTPATASDAAAASEYGSCASLESVERQPTARTATGPDADISSAVDSDASELRRRRRAELVRARTAGDRASVGGDAGTLTEQQGDARTSTDDRQSYSAASSTDNVAARLAAVSTSSSTPSRYVPLKSTSIIDGEFSINAKRATDQQPTRPHQSFQQSHSKMPWRTIRSTSETASQDTVPWRRGTTVDQPQQTLPVKSVHTTLIQPSTAGVTSSASQSTMSAGGMMAETTLKSSVFGSASAVGASQPTRTEPVSDAVATSTSAGAGRVKPRITICSSDPRDRDTPGSSDRAHDRFNELLSKALESTDPSAGQRRQPHDEQSAEPPLENGASAQITDQSVSEKATKSPPRKDDIEVVPRTSEVSNSSTAQRDQHSRQPVSQRFDEEPIAVSRATTNTTQSIPIESVQPTIATAAKVPHRTSQLTGSPQHPSKQYISDSSAFVSVTTEITPVTSTGDILSCISRSSSSQQPVESELRMQGRSPHSEMSKFISRGISDSQPYVGTSQTADHSKLKSYPSSSFAQTDKSQSVHEVGVSRVPDTKTEPSDVKKVPQSDTAISKEMNANVVASDKNHEANAKPEDNNLPPELPPGLKKEPLHYKLQEHRPENREDKTRNAGNRSRQPNVVEETQIVHILSFGDGDSKSHSSTSASDPSSANMTTNNSILSRTADLVTPKPDKIHQQESKSSNVGVGKNVSELPSEERSKLDQTLAPFASLDTSVNRAPTAAVARSSEAPKQTSTLNEFSNRSNISNPVAFSDTASMEPSRLLEDSFSTVEPCQIRHADYTNVEPRVEEEELGRICQTQQMVVVQETEVAPEQLLFQDRKTGLQRIDPVKVASSVHTADAGQFLTKARCHYRSDELTLADVKTDKKPYMDPDTEKIGRVELLAQFERVKPQNVESAAQRRILTKTGCRYHAVVQKSTGDQFRETVGQMKLKVFESESPNANTVVDDTVNRSGEAVKVLPLPKIITMPPERRLPVVRIVKNPRDEFPSPKLGQKMEQKVIPVLPGSDAQKSGVKSISALQQIETKRTLNQEIPTTESTQNVTVSSPRSFSDKSSLSQVHSLSEGLEKPRNNNVTGALIDHASGEDPRDLNSACVPAQNRVLESAEALTGQSADRWRTKQTPGQQQDKASVLYRPYISDKKQPPNSERPATEHVDSAAAATLPPSSLPQAVNTPSALVASMLSRTSQSSAPTHFTASSREENIVPPSNNHVQPITPAATGEYQAVAAQQDRANVPPPRMQGGGEIAAVKRDSSKKARNILRSREDFLALQTPTTSTSIGVAGAIQDDGGKTAEQPEQSATTRRTAAEPAKKGVADLTSDSRQAKIVKVAVTEDDVDDEREIDDVEEEGKVATATDTAKAAFPPLVSGRSWDAIVRSSSASVEVATATAAPSPGVVDRQPAEPPRRTAVASRAAFAAARAETTVCVPESPRTSRPILQMAKSVDSEPSAAAPMVNMDPQLAAVLRMRKQREEELEREEAVLKAEKTENRLTHILHLYFDFESIGIFYSFVLGTTHFAKTHDCLRSK